MYDSRTKMVSSTWFSAESNLEEKEKKMLRMASDTSRMDFSFLLVYMKA